MSTPHVPTARGNRSPGSLGRVLTHEHVFVVDPEAVANFAGWWDEEAAVAKAIADLSDLASAGFGAILDPTVLGLGRDIQRIARVQEQVDLSIIVATGVYIKEQLPRYLRTLAHGAWHPEDRLAQLFLRDIEDGIAGTSIRAGFLKCVVDAAGFTEDQVRVHSAVLHAHVETGTPIMVHTDGASRSGDELVREWRGRGVSFDRVIISHASESDDLDYLRRLLDTGAILGFDKFGLDFQFSPQSRTETLLALIERGYARQIVLSQDYASFADTFADPDGRTFVRDGAPRWGYRYVDQILLPQLKEAGVSPETIDQMLIHNPRRFLTGA